MSASRMEASAPTQASRIRSVLAPMSRVVALQSGAGRVPAELFQQGPVHERPYYGVHPAQCEGGGYGVEER